MWNLIIYEKFTDYLAERVAQRSTWIGEEDKEIRVRINSVGGSVTAGEAIASVLGGLNLHKTAYVDGKAYSMAAYLLLFFDKVIYNETGVSQKLMYHKASWPSAESNPERQKYLDGINSKFRALLEARTAGRPGASEFIKRVFDDGEDVFLNGETALNLGLVDEVRELTGRAHAMSEAAKQLSAEGEIMQSAASLEIVCRLIENNDSISLEDCYGDSARAEDNKNRINNNNSNTMKTYTEDEVKELLAKANKAGAEAEHKRTLAFAAYFDIDAQAAMAGIKNPEAVVDSAVMAQMQVAFLKKQLIQDHKDDNAEATGAPAGDELKAGGKAKTKEELEAEAKAKEDALFDSLWTK